MQDESSLKLCSKNITERVTSIVKCYGGFRRRVTLFCAHSNKCIEVFATSPKLSPSLLERLKPFFAGIHVLRLCNGRPIILLGLLGVINIDNHYAVVNRDAEKRFLYGRDVFKENIMSMKVNEKCIHENIPLVVVNEDGLPIGFARLGKGRIILVNLVDAGWYIRSGV